MGARVLQLRDYESEARAKKVLALVDVVAFFVEKNAETYETIAEAMRSWGPSQWAYVAQIASFFESRTIGQPSEKTREAVIAEIEARATRRTMARALFGGVKKVDDADPFTAAIHQEFGR